MTLYINTISHDKIVIALRSASKIIANQEIIAPRRQSEKLVPAIDNLLKNNKVKLKDLKKIIVANQGSSFTALRIGVITANALAYALAIPVEAEPKSESKNKKFGDHSIVEPQYDRQPNIGKPKNFKL